MFLSVHMHGRRRERCGRFLVDRGLVDGDDPPLVCAPDHKLERPEARQGAHLAAPVPPAPHLLRRDPHDAQDLEQREVRHAPELEADGRVEEERAQAERVRGDLERACEQRAADEGEVAEVWAVLEDVEEVECRVSGGVVAEQGEGRVTRPWRMARGYGRYGQRSKSAMTLARWRRLGRPRRAGERGPGRLFTAGNPQRFDPATTNWMSLKGVMEEMEVVH